MATKQSKRCSGRAGLLRFARNDEALDFRLRGNDRSKSISQ